MEGPEPPTIIWTKKTLQFFIIVGNGLGISQIELLSIDSLLLLIDLDLRLQKERSLDKMAVGVGCEFSANPNERLLKVVVALGRDVIILEVLLPVKLDIFGAHLAILAVYFVPAEADWDVPAHSNLANNKPRIS